MTTTYESIDPSTTDAAYARIQNPEHHYENAVAEHDYEEAP